MAQPTDTCRPGRHLDETRDPEILRAALELLADMGYDRLSMEAIAARARAGKATLYRRWRGKAELVADAVSAFAGVDEASLRVDTGTLRGDLRGAFFAALAGLDDFQVGLMTGLMTALRRNPDLAAAFESRFVAPRLASLKVIFERARDRQEVDKAHDIELLATLGPAILFHRLLLTGKPVTRHFVGRVVDEVILPLAGSQVPARSSRKAKA